MSCKGLISSLVLTTAVSKQLALCQYAFYSHLMNSKHKNKN